MSKSSFTAIITCHENIDELKEFINHFKEQTYTPDEFLIYVSGVDNILDIDLGFNSSDNFKVIPCDNFNDWGHRKRRQGIKDASCEFLGFFNPDELFVKDYIQKLLSQTREADFVYCNYVGKRRKTGEHWLVYSSLENIPRGPSGLGGMITIDVFIVKSSLAKKVGYPEVNKYTGDWAFIGAVTAPPCRVSHVEEFLVVRKP